MGKEAPGNSNREQHNEVIESYLKSARENPEKHLEELVTHADAYLKRYQKLYERRKARYEKQKQAHLKNPKNVMMPLRDPFVVNYENAQKLLKGINKEYDVKKEKENEYRSASNDVEPIRKKMNDRIKIFSSYCFRKCILVADVNIVKIHAFPGQFFDAPE